MDNKTDEWGTSKLHNKSNKKSLLCSTMTTPLLFFLSVSLFVYIVCLFGCKSGTSDTKGMKKGRGKNYEREAKGKIQQGSHLQ
jgi:hypothetical protein